MRSRCRVSAQLCSAVLAKPSPGSTMIRSAATPAAQRLVDPARQLVAHVGDHVAVGGQRLHVGGVPAPVHEHVRAAGVGDHAAHVRVGQPAGDVVDDRGPGLERGRGDRGAGGVDTGRHAGRGQRRR